MRSKSRWKEVLALGRIQSPVDDRGGGGEVQGWWADPADPVHVVHAYAPHVAELWRDPHVQLRLAERRIRLEESSGL